MTSHDHEELLKEFSDHTKLQAYKEKYDNLPVSFFPNLLAQTLFISMDVFYGKKNTIQKFKVLEVIARVPYQTWEFVNYLITTNFYMNEKKAVECALRADEGKFSQDNETMHVVVISQICKQEKKGYWLMHTFAPIIVAYIYFAISTVLYMINRRYSYELNYLFENHAYNAYELFIKENRDMLAQKKVYSRFLNYYKRYPENQLVLFESIKNDEIIHRNESALEMVKINNIPSALRKGVFDVNGDGNREK